MLKFQYQSRLYVSNRKHNLKVREHNIFGPYVNDLSMLAVTEFKVIAKGIHEYILYCINRILYAWLFAYGPYLYV